MEVTIASAVSALIAYLGSGWIGIISTGLVLILLIFVMVSFRRMAAKYAYQKSKESEVEDQLSNRDEAAKLEQDWSESQKKVDEIRAKEPKETKKKRTWLM